MNASRYDLLLGWCLCLLGKCVAMIPTSVCTYRLVKPSGQIVTTSVTSVVLPLHLSEYTVAARNTINQAIVRVAESYAPDHLILGANNKSAKINNYGHDLLPTNTTYSHGNTNSAQWTAGSVLHIWQLLESTYGRNPTVVVTGASSSIGQVLVTLFLNKGCTVDFVTSSRDRFDAFLSSTTADTSRLRFCDLSVLSSALTTCDMWCVGVIPIEEECSSCGPEATLLNFTAVALQAKGMRVLDIGTMRLSPDGVFSHNGQHSHGLNDGEFHSCMIGGILRALDDVQDHEDIVVTDDILESIQIRIPYLGSLGFLPPIPSRPFICNGMGDTIIDHVHMAGNWYPQDTLYIEVLSQDNDLLILEYPSDRDEFEELMGVSTVLDWDVNGDTVNMRVCL